MEGAGILQNRYHLNSCVLLNYLDDKDAQSLLKLFHEEVWTKNTCIINSEKLVYHFFIILSGRVKMYQVDNNGEKEVTLFLLSRNDVFDLFCLLDGCKHDVYYECLDEVKVLAAPMEDLRGWLNAHPQHYKNLLPYAGRQMRMLESYVSDITFTDISTRLLKLLLKNVNDKSRNLEMIHDLSHKELAYLIGSTRAVVNRHLQKFKKNGSIKVTRNKVEIKDLSILIKLLEIQQQQRSI
ncbi:MAG TPA: Crp/Fnr family transcriptional regulator [Gillisia sp.]|nr:Crp/Fnr family transcriptional regulator [Gillisia sp.]